MTLNRLIFYSIATILVNSFGIYSYLGDGLDIVMLTTMILTSFGMGLILMKFLTDKMTASQNALIEFLDKDSGEELEETDDI